MFSSWMASLIEIQALGSLFDDLRAGYSSSHKLIYYTGGQRLPYRGLSWKIPLSLPIQHTYLEVLGSNPVSGKNFFSTKFNCLHEGMIPMLKVTFLSHFLHMQLARVTLILTFKWNRNQCDFCFSTLKVGIIKIMFIEFPTKQDEIHIN